MKQKKKKKERKKISRTIASEYQEGEGTEIEPEKHLTKKLEKYINLEIQKFQTLNRMKVKETNKDSP